MTTILLPTIGSAGDIHPFMAVGMGLKALGLRPRLIANDYFRELITRSGLDFTPLGTKEDYQRMIADPDLWHPSRGFQALINHSIGPAVKPLTDLISQYDPAHTLVVAPGVCYGAGLAHEKWGTPWITVHLQPALFRTAYDTPPLGSINFPPWLSPGAKRFFFRLMDKFLIDRAIGAKVNPVREALGLRPQTGFFTHQYHAPQKSLGLFPAWFALPQPDWPPSVKLTGFVQFDGGSAGGLSPELQTFLDGGEPPLVFTAGTAMQQAAKFFKVSLAAAQALNRRAILLTPHREQLPPSLPPEAIAVAYAPFSQLLPRVALLVHHGGIGTVAQALAAGIPQLVHPLAHDQPDNARRLARLGVSATLPPSAYRLPQVSATLQHLLTNTDVARSCQTWAQKVDFAAALSTTCSHILEMIG